MKTGITVVEFLRELADADLVSMENDELFSWALRQQDSATELVGSIKW